MAASDLKVHISVDVKELDEALQVLTNSVSNFQLKAMIREEVAKQMKELEQRIRLTTSIYPQQHGE